MKLPWRRRRVSRGQALVEFALILPILSLVLVLGIDFGRVFFGWVALNNAARIAASEAGWHPEAWEGSGMPDLQANYQAQVLDDLTTINCAPPGGGTWTPADVPDPTFLDEPGTFSTDPYEVGDHAQIKIACDFTFITPLVGGILGNPLVITADAEFPVKGGEILGVPIQSSGGIPGGGCTGAIVPNLVGQTLQAARVAWTGAGFTGSFTPGSGDDTDTVTAQTTTPSTPAGQCADKSTSVTVTHEVSCFAPQLIGQRASAGQTLFQGKGFTGSYTIDRPPNSDYFIGSQSLVGGQPYLCNSSITVYH